MSKIVKGIKILATQGPKVAFNKARVTLSGRNCKRANKEEIKNSLSKYSKYIKNWEEGEKGDVDSTVQTVRKITEYAEDVYGVASHI